MNGPASHPSLRSEEFFQLIIENVRDYAIFAMDASGQTVSWNPGVKRILGYAEEEFVGRHVSDIFTAEDVERGEVENEMRTATAEGYAEDLKCHLRRDGSRFWASGLLMPLKDRRGNLTGYAKILRDNTRQKKLENEREEILAREREARLQAEELRESLAQAERAKDEFLALLAHELRNPLNAVQGWVKLLRNGLLDEGQTTKALAIIEANAATQNRIIEDVFDVARISSGNLYLNELPMSLSEAVNRAVESVRPAAESKSISLETRLDTETAIIKGDPDRIQQVVTNILSNSVKFTPEGGSIQLSLKTFDSSAQIVIEDNGQGISKDLFPRLFDLYAQADNDSTRGKTGLGLGLPLVHKLVEQHGGRVTAESAGEGCGASFTISLPLIEAS